MKILLALLIALFSIPGWADTKEQKVARLIRVTHLEEQIESDTARAKAQIMEEDQHALEQDFASYTLRPEYRKQFIKAHDHYIRKVLSIYDIDMLQTISSYYAKSFTDNELDQLIKFYASPLGQKDRKVSTSLSEQFHNAFYVQTQADREAAWIAYKTEYLQIATACHCRKANPAKTGTTNTTPSPIK